QGCAYMFLLMCPFQTLGNEEGCVARKASGHGRTDRRRSGRWDRARRRLVRALGCDVGFRLVVASGEVVLEFGQLALVIQLLADVTGDGAEDEGADHGELLDALNG